MEMAISEALYQRVRQAVDTIRPHLEADGGDIEIVNITEDMVVEVKWLGNCQNCTMSELTLRAGVEQAIKSAVPEITALKALNATDIDYP